MLTQREAAQRWGIPWTTFRRAVKAGKVSIGADKRVDPAEMLRAFGEPMERAVIGTNGPVGTSLAHPDSARLTALEIENAALRAERDGLRELVSSKDETIAAMRLLTHDTTPRKRRWWPWDRG